jgi:biopolymer transport protein ExbD
VRFQRRYPTQVSGGDLTPMIDMTFQLIAFFMVLINFSQTELNDRVTLPLSELAKPAETAPEFPIILHMPADGSVILGGNPATVEGLGRLLEVELEVLKLQRRTAADVQVIIRAHRDAAGGRVQELIEKCQEVGFERFALRAKEDLGD